MTALLTTGGIIIWGLRNKAGNQKIPFALERDTQNKTAPEEMKPWYFPSLLDYKAVEEKRIFI